jgi:hypothetical protein
MLDPAHLTAWPFVNREGIEFVAPPACFAVQVSFAIGCLYDFPMGTVLTVASENAGHLLFLLFS